MKLNFKFLHGFWGLLGNISLKLAQFIPLYILVFIAYGDSFLPQPLANGSYQTRTRINNVLQGAFIEKFMENMENEQYNHKRLDKITDEVEEELKNRNN